MMVQWLRLWAPTGRGRGSIPSQEDKYCMLCSMTKERKENLENGEKIITLNFPATIIFGYFLWACCFLVVSKLRIDEMSSEW